jgi:hypothetical protein
MLVGILGVTMNGVWIGAWIYYHLYTSLGTTSNYNTTADFYTTKDSTLSLLSQLSLLVMFEVTCRLTK